MGMTRMHISRVYSRGCRLSEQVKLTGYCRISERLPDLRKVCSPFAYDETASAVRHALNAERSRDFHNLP